MTNPFIKSFSDKENHAPQFLPENFCFKTVSKAGGFLSSSTFSTASADRKQSFFESNGLGFGKLSRGRDIRKEKPNPFSKQFNQFVKQPSQMSFTFPCNDSKSSIKSEAKEEISHENIPPEYRNNEEYKHFLCRRYLKDPKHKTNKTYQKSDFIPIVKQTPVCKDFTLLTKRRKISNFQKVYTGHYEVIDNKHNSLYFKLYRDEDVGMNEEWQEFLNEAKVDEDVESDEEIIKHFTKVVYNDLLEGIEMLKSGDPSEILSNYREAKN